MKVEQFYDTSLAHASYVVLSDGEIAVFDPQRDPSLYYKFAEENNARIVAVIETHPHADFISGHLEIAQTTGATIYVSKLLGANYPHTPFDEGDEIKVGKVTLKALNTPGHSPDSISIVLHDENDKDCAVFTGDTLFFGDVGRPDLREKAGNITAKREELARAMYHSTREKLMKLHEGLSVYPAHGAGSLCGKNLSPKSSSTIGEELQENYALQPMSEDDFVQALLDEQPFVPKYFTNSVELNKAGAPKFAESVSGVPRLGPNDSLEEGILVVDTRSQKNFKAGHLPGALNIQDGGKFETWLGSVVGPEENFYLIVEDENSMSRMIHRTAKIGYERNVRGVLLNPSGAKATSSSFELNKFKSNPEDYTILDVRNHKEVKSGKIFPASISIPLPELRERVEEVPVDKPIVVHCAAGYRSAAGSSILEGKLSGVKIYDLSDAINDFK